jgi:hypothetical protein
MRIVKYKTSTLQKKYGLFFYSGGFMVMFGTTRILIEKKTKEYYF